MALKKQQWNNILIFATVAMIVLFNVTHQRWLEQPSASRLQLVPEQSVILTLEYPAGSLALFGKGWRVSPADLMPAAEAGQLAQQWLGLTAEPVAEALREQVLNGLKAPDFVVRLTLAGESGPRVLLFKELNQRWFVGLGTHIGELSALTIRFVIPEPLRQLPVNSNLES
jgi:hypothetical protein